MLLRVNKLIVQIFKQSFHLNMFIFPFGFIMVSLTWRFHQWTARPPRSSSLSVWSLSLSVWSTCSVHWSTSWTQHRSFLVHLADLKTLLCHYIQTCTCKYIFISRSIFACKLKQFVVKISLYLSFLHVKNIMKFLHQNLPVNSSCNFSLPFLCAAEAKAVAHNSHIADLYQEAV